MLVGWTLPEMDEFGRSNGLIVKGYKASIMLKKPGSVTSQLAYCLCLTFVCLFILQIYANGDVKLEVRSPYMAKVENTRKLENINTSVTFQL